MGFPGTSSQICVLKRSVLGTFSRLNALLTHFSLQCPLFWGVGGEREDGIQCIAPCLERVVYVALQSTKQFALK